MAGQGRIHIGISGWSYRPWRGVFYPPGLPARRELSYAASKFGTIEINSTFYRLQSVASFARWADETPENFIFSVKGSRYITHMLRLRGVEKALATFLASGLLRLGPKLGPILWQLPERFAFDPGRLEAFLKLLPRDMEAAAEMATGYNRRVAGKNVWTRAMARGPLRHAVEVRHPSFVCPEFIRLLRKLDTALVCADAVDWPRLMDVTSDFVYCRLHGDKELYASGYDRCALDQWARRTVDWSAGREPADAERALPRPAPVRGARDVFVYFDNDAKVRAPSDAQSLAQLLTRKLRPARRAA